MKSFWIDVLKVALPVAVAAITYGLAGLVKHIRAKRGAGADEQAAIGAACEAAKKLLDQMLFGAVTAAEKMWGSGAGAAKLDEVRERVLALLPESVRMLVPADWLQRAIEAGLSAAKKRWEANPAMLDTTIAGELLEAEPLRVDETAVNMICEAVRETVAEAISNTTE
jgi:hypothetical protein